MAHILIVDDSASVRQMITFTLSSAGHSVVEATDGSDAINKSAMKQFDVVITDLNMPKMDGIQLIRWLRSQATYKFTPLIMLTTEAQPEKKMEGKAAGATGWIVKPFQPEQLIAVVKKVCPL